MQAHWKYGGKFVLILFAVICISTLQVARAGLQSDASLQMAGSIDYSSFKLGLYTTSWNFIEYNATTIANTFDMSQSWWVGTPPSSNDYTAKMNQVHSLNPNYKALVYRNCMSIYDYWPNEWDYAESQGWLLKDANGNYVTETDSSDNYVVDITSSAYQQWLGQKVALWLQQYPFFDGVMADNSLKYGAAEFNSMCTSAPIDPQTGIYYTDQEIWNGCVGCLNAIINAIGPNKVVLANGIWNGAAFSSYGNTGYQYELSHLPNLTGVMSEGCLKDYSGQWKSVSDWLSSIGLISWMQTNFLSTGKYFDIGCQDASDILPSGATQEQVMMYGFCSALLAINGVSSSGPENNIDFNISPMDSTQLQLGQKMQSLSLGQASDSYYQVSGTQVYARDFTGGKVLVNPSFSAYMVSLNGTYTNFYDGTAASSSIAVPAYTGIVLLG
jgi:hypothetical protein